MTSDTDILNKAADILTTGGWCQGTYGELDSNSGPHCAKGALWRAMVEADVQSTDMRISWLSKLIIEAANHRGNIVSWNDEPNRTASEVISTFRKAASRND